MVSALKRLSKKGYVTNIPTYSRVSGNLKSSLKGISKFANAPSRVDMRSSTVFAPDTGVNQSDKWYSSVTGNYYDSENEAVVKEYEYKNSDEGKKEQAIRHLVAQINQVNKAVENKNWTGTWAGGGHNAIRSAAEKLYNKGVTNLLDLKVVPGQDQQMMDAEGGTYTVKTNALVDKNTGKTVATSDSNNFVLDYYDTGNIFKSTDKTFGITFSPDGYAVPYQTNESGGILSTPILPLALMFVPGMQGLGASIGTALGASGAAATAIGNALVGGALAEAQGGDFVKGALTAGLPVAGEVAAAAGLPEVASGLKTINQLSNLKNAIDSDNLLNVLAAGANLTGTGGTEIGSTGVSVADAIRTADIVDALNQGNALPLINRLAKTGVSTGSTTSTGQGSMGPLDERTTQRFNEEFARYLDSLSPESTVPPDYGIQDLGIAPENWESFNQNLLDMQEEGRLPTQWQPNEGGTFTYRGDDGSTLTIDKSGEILGFTEAPVGSLPGEVFPARGRRAIGGAGGRAPTTTPTALPDAGADLFSVLGLMGMFGEGQQAPQQPVQIKPADVKSFEELGYGELFGPELQLSDDKSAGELKKLLRG